MATAELLGKGEKVAIKPVIWMPNEPSFGASAGFIISRVEERRTVASSMTWLPEHTSPNIGERLTVNKVRLIGQV